MLDRRALEGPDAGGRRRRLARTAPRADLPAGRCARLRRGFTLIEVAVASVLIALGVTALMVASGSATRVNQANVDMTQAVILAQELREWTLQLPFSDPDEADQDNPPGPDGSDPQSFVDDLDDLKDVTYSPPRDGQGQAISHLGLWSQTITITWRNPDDVLQTVAEGGSDLVHVQVTVSTRGEPILTTGWLVARKGTS